MFQKILNGVLVLLIGAAIFFGAPNYPTVFLVLALIGGTGLILFLHKREEDRLI